MWKWEPLPADSQRTHAPCTQPPRGQGAAAVAAAAATRLLARPRCSAHDPACASQPSRGSSGDRFGRLLRRGAARRVPRRRPSAMACAVLRSTFGVGCSAVAVVVILLLSRSASARAGDALFEPKATAAGARGAVAVPCRGRLLSLEGPARPAAMRVRRRRHVQAAQAAQVRRCCDAGGALRAGVQAVLQTRTRADRRFRHAQQVGAENSFLFVSAAARARQGMISGREGVGIGAGFAFATASAIQAPAPQIPPYFIASFALPEAYAATRREDA